MVLLKCVKEGSRLRIKIVSSGYIINANCQFPKALRIEGQMYECGENDITLAKIGQKHFYRIYKNGIKILNEDVMISTRTPLSDDFKVYTDLDEPNCSICLTQLKTLIYVPCGHFITCDTCDKMLKKRVCPMCRVAITYTVTPDQIG